MFTSIIHLLTIIWNDVCNRICNQVILQPVRRMLRIKMHESTTMIKQKIALLLFAAIISLPVFAQPTHAVTDPEKKYKDAKELFVREQFALAYPLFAELRAANPDNTASDHAYLNEDVNYYYIVCELKLQQPVAEQEARHYINVVSNEPRRQLLSYHLAKYYFLKEDSIMPLHITKGQDWRIWPMMKLLMQNLKKHILILT